MPSLELKVPPVIVTLLMGAGMWLIAKVTPDLAFRYEAHLVLAGTTLVCGIAIVVAGVLEFRRAKTTVNPANPAAASSIVTSGIYRASRNPMYLGFLVALIAWTVFLSNVVAAIFLAAFVVYMNRFQIAPEERVLRAKFGVAYETYAKSVRRWI
jgi:protein-S-isoprenylcysteine O-methyltransferase Ste14